MNHREVAELYLTWLILKHLLWHTAPYSLATLAPVGSIAVDLLVNYQTWKLSGCVEEDSW